MLAATLLAVTALGFGADPLAPVLVHDADETVLEEGVEAFAFPVPGKPRGSTGPVAYRRVAAAPGGGTWRQYWLFYADNPQDRGIVRTGRHQGDWELVQYRVDPRGRPVEAVYAQHSGAERCPWREVERRGGHPVAYLANGSHASYFRAGLRDRTWPDPNDEADGRGRVAEPRVQPVSATRPRWMAWPGRWGRSRASWVPWESDSPRGPAHQPDRWKDPDAFARTARRCEAARCVRAGECDGREAALTGGGALVAGLLLGAGVLVRRRREQAG